MPKARHLATLLSSVLALCTTLAVSPAVAVPAHGKAEPISDEARKLFRAGVAYLEDPEGARFEEAYHAFNAAYAASPSAKMLGNIGLCAMKLERDGEAIEAFQRYLAEVKDLDAEERTQVTRDLTTLRAGVVRVDLRVVGAAPGAVVTITDVRRANDGGRVLNQYPVDRGGATFGVHPGHHEIRVRAPGHREASWDLEAVAGSPQSQTLTLEPERAKLPVSAVRADERSLTGPVAVTATGAALLLASAVTGVVALRKTQDIEGRCPNDRCPAGYDLDAERSRTKGFIHTTDGLLVGGAIVAGIGATWLGLTVRHNARATRPGTALTGGASCTGQGCAAAVRLPF